MRHSSLGEMLNDKGIPLAIRLSAIAWIVIIFADRKKFCHKEPGAMAKNASKATCTVNFPCVFCSLSMNVIEKDHRRP